MTPATWDVDQVYSSTARLRAISPGTRFRCPRTCPWTERRRLRRRPHRVYEAGPRWDSTTRLRCPSPVGIDVLGRHARGDRRSVQRRHRLERRPRARVRGERWDVDPGRSVDIDVLGRHARGGRQIDIGHVRVYDVLGHRRRRAWRSARALGAPYNDGTGSSAGHVRVYAEQRDVDRWARHRRRGCESACPGTRYRCPRTARACDRRSLPTTDDIGHVRVYAESGRNVDPGGRRHRRRGCVRRVRVLVVSMSSDGTRVGARYNSGNGASSRARVRGEACTTLRPIYCADIDGAVGIRRVRVLGSMSSDGTRTKATALAVSNGSRRSRARATTRRDVDPNSTRADPDEAGQVWQYRCPGRHARGDVLQYSNHSQADGCTGCQTAPTNGGAGNHHHHHASPRATRGNSL